VNETVIGLVVAVAADSQRIAGLCHGAAGNHAIAFVFQDPVP
jgi:hypothetical protein